jgi:serine/threonine protein kinase
MSHPLLGSRYQIIRRLGGGGFGQTYLAEDQHLPGKPFCVVKHLQPKSQHHEVMQASQQLFEDEAKALHDLGHHPQIPRLTAHFQENNEFYLVQEFIQGTVLSQELKQRRTLTEVEVWDFLIEVLTVLEFVHQHQVIHRDIKPANLIRRQIDGKIILIDFGAVKQLTQHPWAIEAPTLSVAVGSSGYSPPEQLAGKACFASDVYAVGMIGIQALTGILPKQLPTDNQTHEVLWRNQGKVSRELGDILDRMVRYDFRQRYQSVSEVLTDLRILQRETIQANQSEDSTVMWLQRGDGFAQQGAFREALAAYDAAIQSNPLSPVAWLKRGMVLDSLQQFASALTCYDRALQLDVKNAAGWSKRGLVLENLLRPEEALASYRKAVESDEQHYWAWYDQGKVLEQLAQFDVALNAYRRSLQIKPNFRLAIESSRRMLVQMKRLDELLAGEFYEEVLLVADRLLQDQPDDANAWQAQGIALSRLGRFEAALTALELVLDLQMDNVTAWFERGVALAGLARHPDAIVAFEAVIQRQGQHLGAWFERAVNLEKLHQFEAAMLSYNQVLELDGNHPLAFQGRKRMLQCLRQQQADGCGGEDSTVFLGQSSASAAEIELPTEVLTPAATHVWPPVARSEKSDLTADLSNAQRPNEVAIGSGLGVSSLSSLGSGTDHLLKGRILEQLQQQRDTVMAYNQAIQLNPEDPEVLQWRGNLLVALGRYEEAIAAYDRAIQAMPDNATLWCCLAGSLLKLKRHREAINCFDRAIQLKPESHTPWYWRGKVLMELKDWDDSLAAFEQTLALKPDFQPARRDVQRVRSLQLKAESAIMPNLAAS